MTNTVQRRPTPQHLLARILDEPELAPMVQALPARTLARLVDHLGLEDAGELLALASAEQLREVLDEDLWHSAQPGQDEQFDAARFVLWLEVLVEAGPALAARKLTELPEELLLLALHRMVLVVDLDALAVEATGGAFEDALDKALESCPSLELEQYRVVARRHEGWDALAAILAELDSHHHRLLRGWLERLCEATASFLEEHGGLYEVLTSEQMLEVDAAADREDRRAAEGFLSPSSASSLLALARATGLEELERQLHADPVTRAYFRWYAPSMRAPAQQVRATRLVELLEEAGLEAPVVPRVAGRLPGAVEPPGAASRRRLEAALAELAERDPATAEQRALELGYLANVVAAAVSAGGRPLRPLEAGEAALATCALGLDHLAGASETRTLEAVREAGAARLFLIGVHLLHHQLALPALAALERKLAEEGPDPARRSHLAREVRRAAERHAPWALRRLLDELAERTGLGAERAWLAAVLGELPAAPAQGDALRPVASLAELDELAEPLARW